MTALPLPLVPKAGTLEGRHTPPSSSLLNVSPDQHTPDWDYVLSPVQQVEETPQKRRRDEGWLI